MAFEIRTTKHRSGRTGYVYVLADPRDIDHARYVGQTRRSVEERVAQHVSAARLNPRGLWSYRWIRTLLDNGVAPVVIATYPLDVDRLSDVERQLIAWYRLFGHRLTNITDGGEGHSGQKRPEHLAKIAAAHRGMKRPDETCARISAAARGRKLNLSGAERARRAASARSMSLSMPAETRARTTAALHAGRATAALTPRSPESRAKASAALIGLKRGPRSDAHREKLRAANLGKKASAETRAKMSATRLGRKRGHYHRHDETG